MNIQSPTERKETEKGKDREGQIQRQRHRQLQRQRIERETIRKTNGQIEIYIQKLFEYTKLN